MNIQRTLGSIPMLLASSLVACATEAHDPPESSPAEPATETARRGHAYGLTYPGPNWRTGAPEDHGLSSDGLAAMNAVAEGLRSTCMLVVHDGVIVSEWYAPGYGPASVHANLFSVTKSVTSTLVG